MFIQPRSHTIEILNLFVNIAILIVVSRNAEYQRQQSHLKPTMLSNEITLAEVESAKKERKDDNYESLPKDSNTPYGSYSHYRNIGSSDAPCITDNTNT